MKKRSDTATDELEYKTKELVKERDFLKDQLNAIAEMSDEGILIMEDFRIVFANKKACILTGYERFELIGELPFKLIEENHLDLVKDQIVKDDIEPYVVKGVRKDGIVFNIRIRAETVEREGKRVRITFFNDLDSVAAEAMPHRLGQDADYKELIESLPGGIAVHKAGRIIYANSMFKRLMRLKGDAHGMSILDFVAPEALEIAKERINNFKYLKDASVAEFKLKRCDGTYFWAEINSVPILFEGQEAILPIINDISNRKALEEKIRGYANSLDQNNRFIQNIMDSSPIPIFYKNLDGEIEGCNLRFAKFLGAERSKIIGANISSFPLLHYDEFMDDRELLIKAIPMDYELCIYKNDEEIFVKYFKSPYFDAEGKEQGVIGVLLDITQQKRLQTRLLKFNLELGRQIENEAEGRFLAEREKREKEKVLEGLFETSPVGFCIVDGGHNIVASNAQFSGCFGYYSGDLVGKNLKDILPEDERWAELSRYIFGLHEMSEPKEITVVDRFGRKRHLLITATTTKADRATFIIITLSDISSIKELEEKHMLQERLLVQQNRLAEMGNMINVITHQWKQPLNVLSLQMMLLGDALGEEEAGKMAKYFDKAGEQIRFMSKTIDDFREFYKPSKGKKVFDIVKACKDIGTMIMPILERSHVYLRYLAPEQIYFEGYENEFKQVILNLLNNAKESIESKFDQKNMPETFGEIIVEIIETDQGIKVEVSDNGTGIPETLLPDALFEINTSTKGDKGSGVGLSLSKIIIEQNMGGKISARNLEHGAAFELLLPKFSS